MKKRIVVCADGTWNRPEKNLKEDVPTNVIRLARAVSPVAGGRHPTTSILRLGIRFLP